MKVTITEKVFHFRQPAGTSRGVYHTRHSWFVHVDDGCRQGVGECAPLPQLSCDDIPEYEQILQAACRQIEQTGTLHADMLRPYPSMLFGLESALLSVCPAQVPGSEGLSQTPFARGEEGIPINGLVWMGSFEEMFQRLEEKLHAGFRCVKLKIGAIDFEREMELIAHIRRHFTDRQVELRVDANGAFPVGGEAMERLERLAPYGIHSIEQPIRRGQWGEMARLCRLSPLPIALDEELIGVNIPAMKVALLETVRPQYIVLKPSLHGGISGTLEWIALAKERGIGSWITSALESNVGLQTIALLAAHAYGPSITFPQGLGTGQLFTDNIPSTLFIQGEKLWNSQTS